ncbi:MAG: hypothetical protein WBA84_10000 [Carnobacterium sp.]|uniref:hypothetical protein n=1 Tax=Carnobacterium sp. TaxID=48221 RepID=UPI003C767E45
MIKFVDKYGIGFTEEQMKKEGGKGFLTLEEAMNKGMGVTLWRENDGDGNVLSLEAHHAGFLIGLEGDNHLKVEYRKDDQAYVATWFNFDMLKEIKEKMVKYAHLVEGEGR